MMWCKVRSVMSASTWIRRDTGGAASSMLMWRVGFELVLPWTEDSMIEPPSGTRPAQVTGMAASVSARFQGRTSSTRVEG